MLRTLLLALSLSTAAHAAQPMWVVRDGDSTLYLFGTMHLGKAGQSWGGEAARKALEEADELWFEVDLSEDARQGWMKQVMERCADRKGRLLDALGEADRALLVERTRPLGIPQEALAFIQPGCMSVTVAMLPYMEGGYEAAAGAEEQIAALAGGRRLRALETAEEQLDLLFGGSRSQQMEGLRYTLHHADDGRELMEPMRQGWESGDIDALERLIVTPMREKYPEAYRRMLVERNAAWTEILEEELEGAGVDFVAVGAAHLIGPDSVVAMLQKRGLKVERVPDPP